MSEPNTGSQSGAERPEFECHFVNLNRFAAISIIVMWCITIAVMLIRGLEFRPLIFIFPLAAAPMFLMGRRIAKLRVLALYSDYLIFTPSEFTQPQQVEYSAIAGVSFKHWFAHLKVRQPDGCIRDSQAIPFLRVPRRHRRTAYKAFIAKMEALGIPVEE